MAHDHNSPQAHLRFLFGSLAPEHPDPVPTIDDPVGDEIDRDWNDDYLWGESDEALCLRAREGTL